MNDLKEEMDAYNVPVKKREKIFNWGLRGGWSTAGALLVIVICCVTARVREQERETLRSDAREKEMREFFMEKMRSDLRANAEPVLQDAQQYKKSVDSLSKKIDTLKGKI